jgi:fatty-acyl-CoA synthase
MIPTFDWAGKWAEFKANDTVLAEYETGRTLSWGELNNLACFTANWLKNELDIQKGERIAILAENNLELIVLFCAAQKTGIVIVPLNFRLTTSEIDYLIGNCAPKAIVAEHKFADKLTESVHYKQTAIKISIEDFAIRNDNVLASGKIYTFQNELFEEDHPVFLIYTSGTTAFPKGSIYTHKMLFWNSINTQLRLDITAGDRSVNCAPSFHTGGWNVLLTPFLHHGAFTLLMRKFEAKDVLQALEDYNITIWWAVPTMLKMMADETAFEIIKVDKLRYFIVGGEAMPIPLIEIWHKKGILIRQGYGLTEVGPNVTSLNHSDAIRKQGSIGKPNFYYQIRIADEKGNEMPAGEAGELLLKGPTVTPGYWNNDDATRENIIDGWFHTGDLVKRDEEGFLYVVDRLKNMYISGAENVYPAEVEFQLRKHPSIDNVAIIGIPDEKWGESGMAFISLRAGEKLTADEVIAFCTDKLAKYKIPKHIRFMDELPKNDAGKTDRKKLKTLTQPKASH